MKRATTTAGDQPPEAIGDGADAALAAMSGDIMAGDDASIDGLLAGPLIELELLALMSGAGVVVALGAGASAVLEQPARENTAQKATAESVVKVEIRVIVSSCPVLED